MPNPNNQNNQNNQNENNLSEVRKILDAYENQLNGMHFNNAELNELHVRFKDVLHDLNTATDHFYTRDDRGNYPTIDAHEFTLLDDLYQQAYRTATALETGLQQADPEQLTKNDRIWKNVYDTMMNMVRDVLGQDLQHLHSVQRNGNETLPAIIEQARTRVYNVDGQEMEHVGEGLSSRIAITIPGENGDVRGFFTESVSTDQENEIERIRREMIEEQPELEPVLRNFQLQNYNLAEGAQACKRNLIDGSTAILNGILEGLPDRNLRKQVTENGKLMSGLLSFLEQRDKAVVKYMTLDGNQLGANDKMDQRNCAMSTVADLLGMPELLAHAEPVQIKFTKNGREKTLSGSFMHFGEGQDSLRQVPGQGLLKLDVPVDGNTASVKKQTADLQVLDYICGNVDRHGGNVFYQLDESDPAHTRLAGIQGIDNDASFTNYCGPDGIKFLPAPTKMVAIRSQTAALVEGLDRDMLKTMLRNYNLTETQLDAVWTRTQNLQNAIRDGREFFRDKPENELSSEHLRVIDDDAFERVTLDQLAGAGGPSYFRAIINGVTSPAIKNYVEGVKKKDENQFMENRAVFQDALRELKGISKELQDADSAFRRRPEYSEVKRTTKALYDMGSLNMVTVLPKAIRERMPRLREAMAAADAYLQHKQTEFNRERGEISAQFEAGSISERARKKAMNKIREKYKGADSADAKRIRAVVKLKKMLRKSLESGEKALQAADEFTSMDQMSRNEHIEEIRRRSPQNQAPQQAMQQPADVHQEPARENRRGRMRLSAADLQEKLDGQAPDKGRKSVPHKAAQQKELGRSNSMG